MGIARFLTIRGRNSTTISDTRCSSRQMEETHAAHEACFEAKTSEGSRTGGGSRRRVFVAGGGRIRSNRLCRPRMYRRGVPPRPQRLSVRKKLAMSTWGRSTSSTRKTPERPDLAKDLPEAAAADAVGAATAAAAAEAAAVEAAAVEAAAAVCRGEFAASARLERAARTCCEVESASTRVRAPRF